MREIYVCVFIISVVLVLYALAAIKRVLEAVVQQLNWIRRISIDARDTLEHITRSGEVTKQ